jgi:hypothetical protein
MLISNVYNNYIMVANLKDKLQLQGILTLAATNIIFNRELPKNPEKTINDFKGELGFTWGDMDRQSQKIVQSFTQDDWNKLHEIYNKLKDWHDPFMF